MTATDFSDGLADVLAGVQRLIRRRLRSGMTGPRLRGAESELLRLVVTRPGIRVSAAAKELYLAGNSVSTLVNRLASAGLLTRETDPQDRRSTLLCPTQEARERLADWQARRSELVGRQVAGLPAQDRAALEAALPALRRLAQRLNEDHEEPEEHQEGEGTT